MCVLLRKHFLCVVFQEIKTKNKNIFYVLFFRRQKLRTKKFMCVAFQEMQTNLRDSCEVACELLLAASCVLFALFGLAATICDVFQVQFAKWWPQSMAGTLIRCHCHRTLVCHAEDTFIHWGKCVFFLLHPTWQTGQSEPFGEQWCQRPPFSTPRWNLVLESLSLPFLLLLPFPLPFFPPKPVEVWLNARIYTV